MQKADTSFELESKLSECRLIDLWLWFPTNFDEDPICETDPILGGKAQKSSENANDCKEFAKICKSFSLPSPLTRYYLRIALSINHNSLIPQSPIMSGGSLTECFKLSTGFQDQRGKTQIGVYSPIHFFLG